MDREKISCSEGTPRFGRHGGDRAPVRKGTAFPTNETVLRIIETNIRDRKPLLCYALLAGEL
jgi:hypothetical protein